VREPYQVMLNLLNEILQWKITVLEDEVYVIWLLCFLYPEVKA
jgi:hypothetical protein